jgi:hypothetical protein
MRSDRIKDTDVGFILSMENLWFLEDFEEEIETAARDKEHFNLLLFLLYEYCKGKDSLWYPYFAIVK